MPNVSIIIPCFNEERRLRKDYLLQLLRPENNVTLIFVNDGSTDNTLYLLEEIRQVNQQKVKVISYLKNKGKAYAVFKGLEYGLFNGNFAFIGYLDADLSTSTDEFLKLVEIAEREKADFVFGSRVKMLNHSISRSAIRHICGRMLTTIIDLYYKLGIYDTQCGAKLFSPEIARIITRSQFKTKWLFDVEIFIRIREARSSAKGLEVPLKQWIDPGKSKISLLSFPKICREIVLLIKNY